MGNYTTNPRNHSTETVARGLQKANKLLTVQYKKLRRWQLTLSAEDLSDIISRLDQLADKLLGVANKRPIGVEAAHNSGVSTLPIAPIMPTIGSSQSKIEQVFEMYESAYSVQDTNGSIWGRFLDAYSALDVNEQGLLYNKLCEFYSSNPPWGFSEVSE